MINNLVLFDGTDTFSLEKGKLYELEDYWTRQLIESEDACEYIKVGGKK